MNETKFDGMGRIYAQYRPSYPQSFIDYLFSDVGVTMDSVIADIGSGTGILTRQLLEKGNRVYAVEPNTDMRMMAEENLKAYPGFTSVNGTAEHTPLAGNSIDFITVAQAFHWFDRVDFKKECQRILTAGGKVILIWNNKDEHSEQVQKLCEIHRAYCPNFQGFSGGMQFSAGDLFSTFFDGAYKTKVFRNDLVLDLNSFIGGSLSSSYAPKKQDEIYPAYIAALKAFFLQFSKDGQLILPNVTLSYVGSV